MPDTSPQAADPNSDPAAWQTLEREAQDKILKARLDAREGGPGGGARGDGEPGDTLAALEQRMSQTWWATLLGDVPVEFQTLTSSQQEALIEQAQTVFAVSEAGEGEGEIPESADDLDDNILEQLDELADWLPGFLADVSADERLDHDWWADGDNYPQGFKLEAFMALFERVADSMEQTATFRRE